MSQQILLIPGGKAQRSYEEYLEFLKIYHLDLIKMKNGTWKEHLREDLGPDFRIFFSHMPSALNAKYIEWKIWFEKFFPYLTDEIVMVGVSLGGLFLAKYLSENDFPVKIRSVFLVDPIFDENKGYIGDFKLTGTLEKFRRQCGDIKLFIPKDNPTKSNGSINKYALEIPEAEKVIFEDRDIFTQLEFPELVEKIRSL
jgi:hypothetical protein